MPRAYGIGRGLLAALLALTLAGCASGSGGTGARAQDAGRYQRSDLDVFDTVTTMTTYDADASAAAQRMERLHDELVAYHELFDIYHSYEGVNNLRTINENAGVAPVEADARIIDMLRYAKEMHALTGGRVNVAMGSVLSIWHDYRTAALEDPAQAALPPMEQLRTAAAHTEIDDVIIDEAAGTVYLADAQMRLDVGAIAKGYAAQKAMESLHGDSAAASLLLSVGGNVCVLGTRSDGTPWRVAVENPDGGEPLCTVLLGDGMTLVTSGSYQRYYTVDGVRYHHIIDPETLLPAAYFTSVTVLSRDSAQADALSTALFNMDLASGLALVDSLADVEAFWLDQTGKRAYSAGFASYFAS